MAHAVRLVALRSSNQVGEAAVRCEADHVDETSSHIRGLSGQRVDDGQLRSRK